MGISYSTNLQVKDAATRYTLFSARHVTIQFDPARLLAFPARPLSSLRQVMLDKPSLYLQPPRRGRVEY